MKFRLERIEILFRQFSEKNWRELKFGYKK